MHIARSYDINTYYSLKEKKVARAKSKMWLLHSTLLQRMQEVDGWELGVVERSDDIGAIARPWFSSMTVGCSRRPARPVVAALL